MGKKTKSGRKKRQQRNENSVGRRGRNENSNDLLHLYKNFVAEAGPGCYIARRDIKNDWLIEWEDIGPEEFDEGEEVPDVAIDVDEKTLSLCNVDECCKIAYITVYEARVLGRKGQEIPQGSTTDNNGTELPCVTFIVLCPPLVFAHLCFIDPAGGLEDNDNADITTKDITDVRIESDVREWNRHPNPSDEHPKVLDFPLSGGPFLCTQGEGGELTHFFSGNLHALDFACPVGTPLVAVEDGIVIDVKQSNTLTGVAVSNLFEWNSIMLRIVDDEVDHNDSTTPPKLTTGGPLFVEYVHIQSASVNVGDQVKRGQIIGSSGSVGFSPEPHLHFSAFRSSDPEAATVRVRFHGNDDVTSATNCPSSSTTTTSKTYLPQAGRWYDKSGLVLQS